LGEKAGMNYKRDIKKIIKEKNRLEDIVEKLGTSPWEIGRSVSSYSREAEEHLQLAIEQLHKAELALRKYDWD